MPHAFVRVPLLTNVRTDPTKVIPYHLAVSSIAGFTTSPFSTPERLLTLVEVSSASNPRGMNIDMSPDAFTQLLLLTDEVSFGIAK